MAAPKKLQEKSPEEIRGELIGFPAPAVDAALAFRETGAIEPLEELVLGVVEFYLPQRRAHPLRGLPPTTRFVEDLGVDSLTLAELAFKLDGLFGVPIETREVAQLRTLGELSAFLRRKLGK